MGPPGLLQGEFHFYCCVYLIHKILKFMCLVFSALHTGPVVTSTSRTEVIRFVDVRVSVFPFVNVTFLLTCAVLFTHWGRLCVSINRGRFCKSPFRKHKCKTKQFENLGYLDLFSCRGNRSMPTHARVPNLNARVQQTAYPTYTLTQRTKSIN
jgi:hypothetical protein